MDRSIYTPLSTREDVFEIRLLRLQPNVDPDAMISCSLITYPLHQDERPHLYEALSYVWGDPHITKEIVVGGFPVNVTRNLHAALWQLRDQFFERVLWIDALCIDQENPDEVSRQILSMARIYGQASCVLIWLGEKADNSDTALEYIRACGAEEASLFEEIEATKCLLARPWFSRIWVLQEAASARRIQVLCGSKILDGNAFSTGVQKLQPQLPVNHFIRRAAFLSPIFGRDPIRAKSNPNRLGTFLDMYHSYSATKQHDKVYALLGMSAGLSEDIKPDYTLPWHQLFRKTIHHILGTAVRVRTWLQREIATISGLAFVLGTVSSIQIGAPDYYRARVSFLDLIGREYTLTIPLHSRLIRKGDVVCLLQGASEATVIRPCEDFFQIIAIQVPLQHMLNASHVDWPNYLKLQHELLLIWDWEVSAGELHGNLEHQSLTKSLRENFGEPEILISSTKSARMLKVAEILFESNRWRYFQTYCWRLRRWPEHEMADRKICERLQTILDDHRDLLRLDTAAILGIMWKLLFLYLQAKKKQKMLDMISQSISIQPQHGDGDVWQLLSVFKVPFGRWHCKRSCNLSLELLIIGTEAAESSLLDLLIHHPMLHKEISLSSIDRPSYRGTHDEEEEVLLSFLRTRKEGLGFTGAMLICMFARSDNRPRVSFRLHQLLLGSERKDTTAVAFVHELILCVQTSAALVLRSLCSKLRIGGLDHWADPEAFKLLVQRAKTDSTQTDKLNDEPPRDFDEGLDRLLNVLYSADLTLTEEMLTVAVETLDKRRMVKLVGFENFNVRITQEILGATQKNTQHGEAIRDYLLSCEKNQHQSREDFRHSLSSSEESS